MIVIMMANTPSLNASSRFFSISNYSGSTRICTPSPLRRRGASLCTMRTGQRAGIHFGFDANDGAGENRDVHAKKIARIEYVPAGSPLREDITQRGNIGRAMGAIEHIRERNHPVMRRLAGEIEVRIDC